MSDLATAAEHEPDPSGPAARAVVSLVRSKQRVADDGEVFTPPELVEAMIGLVESEAERIDSRFLEPACGALVPGWSELEASSPVHEVRG